MNLSRRKFLSGAAAGVAVMAMPLSVVSVDSYAVILPPATGMEHLRLMGLIIRDVEELCGMSLEMLGAK